MKRITRFIAFVLLLTLLSFPISFIPIEAASTNIPPGASDWSVYRGGNQITYDDNAMYVGGNANGTTSVCFTGEEYTYYEMTADITVITNIPSYGVSSGIVYRTNADIQGVFIQNLGTTGSTPRAISYINNAGYSNSYSAVRSDDYTSFIVGETVSYRVVVSKIGASDVISTWAKVKGKDVDYRQVFENVSIPSVSGNSGFVGFFVSRGMTKIDNVKIKSTVTNKTRTFNFDNVLNEDGFAATKLGASVRMTFDTTGLRFSTNIGKSAFDSAVAVITSNLTSNYSISYGTIIAPMAYVDEAGEFTLGALDALNKTSEKYLMIPTREPMNTENNIYHIEGSIVNLGATAGKSDHRTLDFAGIVYICATDNATGEKSYIYADSYLIRSVSEVATAALNDISTIQSSNYAYIIQGGVHNAKFSPYTNDQRAIIKTLAVEFLDIVKNGKSEFVIVRNNLEKNNNTPLLTFNQNIQTQINSLTGAMLTLATDSGSKTYEILVGMTNRPETAQVLSTFNVSQYGVVIVGQKIVVAGWNSKTTELAVAEFNRIVQSNLTTGDGGKKNLSLPSDTCAVFIYDPWSAEIPEFDGGNLNSTEDANNDAYQLYYTDTNIPEYRAYRQKLVSNGYILHCDHTAVGNEFSTYYKGNIQIHAYYIDYLKSVRIIVGPLTTLAPTTPQQYTKITESKITQLALNYGAGNFGNSYIITLEDGSFIIYDGGGPHGYDYVNMYNMLNTLNARGDGRIVIAAWIITHDHGDHTNVFNQLAANYGGRITLEYLVANGTSEFVRANSNNPEDFMDSRMFLALAKFNGTPKFVKIQTGQVLKFRNAEIEVLFTYNDLIPERITVFNNTSTVTRVSIGGQTFINLGDIETAASNVMLSMYGSYLKSDFAQVSHHGFDGATKGVYDAISPDILFWPTSQSDFNKQTTNFLLSYYKVDRYIRYNLGVKQILVADGANKTIILPYSTSSTHIENPCAY